MIAPKRSLLAVIAAVLSFPSLVLGAQSEFNPVTRVPPIHSFCGGFDTSRLVDTVTKAFAEAPSDILWMRPCAR